MSVQGMEAQVYATLAARAEQMGAQLKYPVNMPAVDFTPPTATSSDKGYKVGERLPYLSVTYMPNGSALDGLPFDGDPTLQGLLQVSVFWPNGKGLVKPLQLAALVVGWFPPGLVLESNGVVVRFDVQASVSAPLQDSDLAQVPVTIQWRAELAES